MKIFFSIKLVFSAWVILGGAGLTVAWGGQKPQQDDYSIYEQRAWALMREPNREKLMPTVILSNLNRAIQLALGRVRADSYNLRSCCWDKVGDEGKSVQDMMTVIEKEPNSPKSARVYCTLAAVWGERKEFQKALEYINRSIELESDYAVSHLVLSLIYKEYGRLDEAKEELRQSIEMDPQITNAVNISEFFNDHDDAE